MLEVLCGVNKIFSKYNLFLCAVWQSGIVCSHYSSFHMSNDNSEIILICWFGAQEKMSIIIIRAASLTRY